MNDIKKMYFSLYHMNLRTIKDGKEYFLGVEFMDGYPRFTVRESNKKYPDVKVTFTLLGIMTLFTAMKNVLDGGEPITIDSKNYNYENNVKSDDIVSVGKITTRVDAVSGALILNIAHGEYNLDFPVLLDAKFFNFYINGTNVDKQMYYLTANAYIDAMKQLVSNIHTHQIIVIDKKRKKERDEQKSEEE